ncbi:TonB-dependent siderophore receptor [Acinetobacter pittii]|uniref:TonB-dependent receptor n=1 Tax=Acinetobacter pittii TaxID=48296 RepID=UPI001EFC5119|nr:TonB-dependent siderophore receptor [Acinetobacter pittii]MCG9491213.1 TonB-dependent siderophore receptor [Acinetobacter pittii]
MKHFSKKRLVNSISLAFLGLSANHSLFAAEVSMLPTIKVQAEQQPESFAKGNLASQANLGVLGNKKIIDIPFSITEYTSGIIEEQQASTVGEVLKNDPSIRITTNQGHLNENFKVRGFDLNHEDMAYNGLYGVAPYGRVPTEFLESITLLKGPNALVSGVAPTGSVGGVIIAHSKRADKELTRLFSSFEDQNYYQSGFDISRRFGQQKEFGIRLNGVYGDGEHIIEEMNDRHVSGALAADYTTDKLKINFDSYAIKENRKGGSPAMVAMGGNNSINQVIAPPKGNSNFFPHLRGNTESKFVGLSSEYKFTPDFKAFAGIGYIEKEYQGHLFGTRMIITDTNGAATSQYYQVGSKEHNTAANVGFENKFNTGSVKHTVGLRADYLKRKYTQHKAATTAAFNTNLYQPSANGGMPTTLPDIVPFGDNEYISYTLTDQLSMLDDKLQLILGARYQNIDTKNLVKNTSYSKDKVSPSLGIVIKPFGESLSFYASYVEGLSEGTTVDNNKDANNRRTFAPFQTKQYEVGAKYQVGTWLNTLAIYQIEKPNTMSLPFSDPQDKNITQITVDGAETRSRGIEWGFSGEVLDGLNLLGNLAYIKAEITKAQINVGNDIYGVPKLTGSLGLDYQVPQIEGLNLTTRATYVGEQYLNSANTLELPSYTVVDIGARYKTVLGGVSTTFLANVDNVANKKYWEGVFNDNYAVIGGARTYKVGLTFDF